MLDPAANSFGAVLNELRDSDDRGSLNATTRSDRYARAMPSLDKDEHERLRYKPVFFFQAARRLAVSATLLAELARHRPGAYARGEPLRSDPGDVHFMLLGMALEDVFKGQLARQVDARLPAKPTHQERLQADKSLTKGGGHNLLDLADECGLSLRDNFERRLLQDLSAAITGARYPLPRPRRDEQEHQQQKLDPFYLASPFGEDSWSHACDIFQRAAEHCGSKLNLRQIRTQLLEDMGMALT